MNARKGNGQNDHFHNDHYCHAHNCTQQVGKIMEHEQIMCFGTVTPNNNILRWDQRTYWLMISRLFLGRVHLQTWCRKRLHQSRVHGGEEVHYSHECRDISFCESEVKYSRISRHRICTDSVYNVEVHRTFLLILLDPGGMEPSSCWWPHQLSFHCRFFQNFSMEICILYCRQQFYQLFESNAHVEKANIIAQ